jgi:predicted amidohydrolase YtcJ
MNRSGSLLITFLLALTLSISACQQSGPDLVLLNAHIVTIDPQRPSAEAVAVRGDRIVWVGTTAEANQKFPHPSRSLDLGGATVLPGITDAHTHLINLGESYLKINLKDVPTEEEIVERVRQRVAASSPGEWILGWGWDEGKWASRYPTNEGLNRVAPNNPVFLVGLHTFAAWANQKALELAGIDKATRDPEKGKIIRDEKTGEPTGILMNSAQDLVARHIPPLTLDQVKKALELGAAECVRNGLTAIHEAGTTPVMIEAFRELIREGRLPLRVYAMLDGADERLMEEWFAKGPEIDSVNHRLTIRSVKLFADGALGSRGALLFKPYSDAPQTSGVATMSEDAIYRMTRRCLERGFQVATHAIGDAANHMVLNAYERALKEVPGATDARLRVEHVQVIAPADVPRFAKLGVIASMQPVHCTSDMGWAEQRLGPERIKGAYAWRSVLATGAHVPTSSDFPGETLNPFLGMYAAVTRQDAQGRPEGGWHPEQRMTLQEVLRGYTVEAAYAEFEEGVKGAVKEGMLADFTVISEDITKPPATRMLSVQVLKTIVGGKVVYEKLASQ